MTDLPRNRGALDYILLQPCSTTLADAAVATAVAGARIGTRLLGRLDDSRFRRISGLVVLALGALCFGKGALDTING